ncbi:hypothetical protein [Aquipuribacter nitratireducens]|uniref:Uncharacterized protein n=1 Tax=Aquipuribacter nitratireducens TaxID=650104 RepID=A0ABW0GLI7_9MICO
MAETGRGFWHSAPGVITAVAALLTAVGGLLGILFQYDVLPPGGRAADAGPPAAAPAVVATSDDASDPHGAAAATASGSSAPDADPPLVPWTDARASLVRDDGTTLDVRAMTVGLTCDRQRLAFVDGRTIQLEDVRSIRIDAVFTESPGFADATVELLDGTVLTESVLTRNCPVAAADERGTVSVPVADVARIDFLR